jgi:hypothetical protein
MHCARLAVGGVVHMLGAEGSSMSTRIRSENVDHTPWVTPPGTLIGANL